MWDAGGRLRDERGSAPVEFVLVGVLLTTLTLAVMQLALALLIRNTLQDAAAEGARHAALAGNTLDDGVARTQDLVATAIGDAYAQNITAAYGEQLGHPSTAVLIIAPLPLIGLFGPSRSLEVTGHAALETLVR
jgi:Flp pilus assembly protein TadG